MSRRLTRVGNDHAIVLDQGLPEATGIDADTLLHISTDGSAILISPVQTGDRPAKLKRGMDRTHERYDGAFRRLAE